MTQRPTLSRPKFDLDFSKSPFTLAWEITQACALKCVHCRANAQTRRDPRELTLEEGYDLIDQAAKMGTQVFVITGGDPLKRPDVFELISKAAKTGMHVGFSPSVTPRLTADALAKAVDAGAQTIHLSLDGATAKVHDGFRGVDGSYVRTMSALEAATKLGVRVQIGTSVSRKSVDDIPGIVPLLEGKVDLWSLFFLVPTGRAHTDDLLSADEHEQMLKWLATADISFPARTIAAPTYRRVRAQLGLSPGPGVNDGNGFCFVSHVGDVCPSGFLQLPAGNFRDQSLAHWYRDSDLFTSLRDPKLLKGKCGVCDFQSLCGGSRARAWGMTGDVLASDPTCSYQPPMLQNQHLLN